MLKSIKDDTTRSATVIVSMDARERKPFLQNPMKPERIILFKLVNIFFKKLKTQVSELKHVFTTLIISNNFTLLHSNDSLT